MARPLPPTAEAGGLDPRRYGMYRDSAGRVVVIALRPGAGCPVNVAVIASAPTSGGRP